MSDEVIELTEEATRAKLAGRHDLALRLYERALALAPTHVDALYNLGVLWMEAHESDRAIFLFELAARFDPAHADALNNLGVLYKDRGAFERAAHCYLAALKIRPRFAEALNNLALVHQEYGNTLDAMALLRDAIAVKPGYATAHANLGVALLALGRVPEAIDQYRACLALNPDDRNAQHNLLIALNYIHPGDDARVADAHLEWGQSVSERVTPLLPVDVAQRAGAPERPLVIGYLSPDLFTHSVSYFIEAPLAHHDPARVRVEVYNCSARGDHKTERLRRLVEARGHHWHDVWHLHDQALAQLIRQHEVDLLIDLTGHMQGNRLLCLALRPAPLQLTWIGYPNTTGLTAIDYLVTDAICDPLDTRQRFAEELVRLDGSFLCYTPAPETPEVAPPPALVNRFVTFGSFNNLAKITPEVMRAWAGILESVPASRLLLKNTPFATEGGRRETLALLRANGIDAERVELLPRELTLAEHLASYARMDVSLDPWPYTGTTSTCESLLMGVPCITLRGRGHAHNVGASLLTAAGLGRDWIAHDIAGYREIARAAASDVPRLAELRRGMRGQLLASPLCDGAAFVARLEKVYRELWNRRREHAAGQ